jgi:hypothetical protein
MRAVFLSLLLAAVLALLAAFARLARARVS